MPSKQLSVCLAICLGACHAAARADHPAIAFGSEGGGAINTISTQVLPAGSWGIGLRSEIIDNDEFSTGQLEDFAASGLEGVHSIDSITNTSLSLFYSATENLGVSARLPYIKRENIRESELDGGVPEAHTHGDSSGMGDLLLLAQYRMLERNDTSVSVLIGVKAPAGETKETDDDGVRFETEFQPGSGSWDYLLGASISKNVGKFGYHANILYNLTTEGSQSTEIGDALSYNAALTYRLGEDHAAHGHDHHHGPGNNEFTWDMSVELNGETRQKNKISGVSEDNSGGTTIYLAPGIRVSSGTFGGFISYGIPIVDDQHGIQTEVDSRIVAGISLAM
jgi:hypothetical protein